MSNDQTTINYKYIEQLAEKYFLMTSKSIPVDLDLIIEKIRTKFRINLIVKEEDCGKKFSGIFVKISDTDCGILLNSTHHIHRKRFT